MVRLQPSDWLRGASFARWRLAIYSAGSPLSIPHGDTRHRRRRAVCTNMTAIVAATQNSCSTCPMT